MRQVIRYITALCIVTGGFVPLHTTTAFSTTGTSKFVPLQRPSLDAPAFHKKLSLLTRLATSGPDVQTIPSSSSSTLQGVTEFEQWFSECPGSKCDARIAHADFGGLRGLQWTDGSPLTMGETGAAVASVPSSVVLQAAEDSSSQQSWDTELACKLWQQVLQGSTSPLYGYLCLLTQGSSFDFSDNVPPSTAPNALRHWNDEQRKRLSSSDTGTKLLELDIRQQKDWKQKYDTLSLVGRPATFAQFAWAMEVVHSRAFRGVDTGTSNSLFSILAPVVAGFLGYAYYSSTAFPNELVFYGLGVLAVAPLIKNVIEGSKKCVVLLPLIDSANHLETAGSLIEFNPLSGCFELSLQPSCLVQEDDGKRQLYISYGVKKDTELLLNHGFLPGVGKRPASADEASRDVQRQALAEAFLTRNA